MPQRERGLGRSHDHVKTSRFAVSGSQLSQSGERSVVNPSRTPSLAEATATVGEGGNEAILAIDLGTTSAKASLVWINDGGRQTGLSRVNYSTISPCPFHVIQKKDSWFEAMIAVASSALKACDDGASIAAIAVTGQMQDLIGVGDDIPELLKDDVVLYSDSRAVAEAERMSSLAQQLIQPTSLLAKLALLPRPVEDNPPASYRLLFGAADYAIFRLSADPTCCFTDPTTISTTGLSASPHRNYNVELLKRVGLEGFLPLFPKIQSGFQVCSYLSQQAANALGRPDLKGTPLVHAAGDAASATLGAGCITSRDGDYLYIGTSGWIGGTVSSSRTCQDTSSGIFSLGHPQREEVSIELASIASAGLNFAYAASSLLGGISLSQLDQLAVAAPIGANGVVYVPYLSGLRCPQPNSLATGALCGLQGSSSRSDIARAIFEGVAFAYRACAECLRGNQAGIRRSSALPIVGGAAHSDAFLQILSGALEVPVRRGPTADVGTRGAAVAAMMALQRQAELKAWDEGIAWNEVQSSRTAVNMPNFEEREAWNRSRQNWMRHVESLRKTWDASTTPLGGQ